MQSPKLPIAIALTDLLFGIVAFVIVGVLTKDGRFRHLVTVVLASWVAGLVNVVFFDLGIGQWALSLPFLAFVMLVGAGISWLFVPPTQAVK